MTDWWHTTIGNQYQRTHTDTHNTHSTRPDVWNFPAHNQRTTLIEQYRVSISAVDRWVYVECGEWFIRDPTALQRSKPSTPETAARRIHTSAKNQSQQFLMLHSTPYIIPGQNRAEFRLITFIFIWKVDINAYMTVMISRLSVKWLLCYQTKNSILIYQ